MRVCAVRLLLLREMTANAKRASASVVGEAAVDAELSVVLLWLSARAFRAFFPFVIRATADEIDMDSHSRQLYDLEEDGEERESIFQQYIARHAPVKGKKKGSVVRTTSKVHQSISLEEENRLLISLLREAKEEREVLLASIDTLRKRHLEANAAATEAATRRALEAAAFRTALQAERVRFDDRLAAARATVRARERVVVDLVEICTRSAGPSLLGSRRSTSAMISQRQH